MLKARFDLGWLTMAVCCTLSVLTLTHLPQDPTPRMLRQGILQVDKAEHFIAYGTIALLFMLSLKKPTKPSIQFFLLGGIAFVGMVDELTQPLVGREGTLTDFLANLTGIVLCGLVFLGIRLRRGGKAQPLRDR